MAADDPPVLRTLEYASGGPSATLDEQPAGVEGEPSGQLGRYVLQERLGAGGMGVVFAAYDPELARKVALKVLRGGPWQVGQERQARLLREAQAMARLSHPNVVAVHDVGQVDGRVFVAAEYVDGWNVRQWLAQKKPKATWREVVRVYLEAGRGLAAAHAASLVHRDFKPDNVLVARDGRARVTDFGLALPAPPSGEASPGGPLEVTRGVAGTPAYMAPEQARGTADARSDQYSFAASLHEGLHGWVPEGSGAAAERMGVAAASPVALRAPTTPLRGEVAGRSPVRGESGGTGRAPRRVRRILGRALSHEPDDRYPTLVAMLGDLERAARFRWRGWLAGAGVLAAVLVLGPGVRLVRARAAASCADASAAASVWSAARRAEVRAAFRGTRLPYAEGSADRLDRALGADLAAWREARREACASTHLERTQPRPILALRLGCLDDHLRDVRAMTNLFASSDAQLVQSSAEALSVLTPLARCADVRALSAGVAAPAGQTARHSALREELVRAGAFARSARYREGLGAVASVLAGARQLGDPALEADARLLEGELRFGLQEYGAAEKVLLEAMAAAEASRHEEVRVRAAITLAELLSADGQNERAQAVIKLARAALGRLSARPDLEGRILFVEARTEREPRAALERCRQALARFEESVGAESNEVAVAENMLGWMLSTQGAHEAALPHLRRAVAVTRTVRGGLHPNLSVALGNLSVSLGVTGQQEELRQVLEEQLAVVAANYQPPPPGVGLVRVRLASALWVLGRLDDARREVTRAEELMRAAGDASDLGHALAVSGAIHLSGARYPEARADFSGSVRILEAAGASAVAPLLGLGVTEVREGHAARAVAPLERAHGQVPAGTDRALIAAFLGRALLESGRDPARGRMLLAEARPVLAPQGHVTLSRYPAAIADELDRYYRALPDPAP